MPPSHRWLPVQFRATGQACTRMTSGGRPLRRYSGSRIRVRGQAPSGDPSGGMESRLRESDDEWVTQIPPSVRAETGGKAGWVWN